MVLVDVLVFERDRERWGWDDDDEGGEDGCEEGVLGFGFRGSPRGERRRDWVRDKGRGNRGHVPCTWGGFFIIKFSLFFPLDKTK